jgi:hypothetical protein
MLRRLFGTGKKQQAAPGLRQVPLDATIKDAQVGDEVSIVGLSQGFDDVYRTIERRDNFVIEQVNRYESDAGEWFELIGVDEDRRLWIEWADEDELFVTATTDKSAMGLSVAGLAEDSLIRMDEENSIDNFITYEGTRYFYKNSHEVIYFQDNLDKGEGFYLWDFVSVEVSRALSVVKWEGVPFQVFISEIVPPGNITVRRHGRPQV